MAEFASKYFLEQHEPDNHEVKQIGRGYGLAVNATYGGFAIHPVEDGKAQVESTHHLAQYDCGFGRHNICHYQRINRQKRPGKTHESQEYGRRQE